MVLDYFSTKDPQGVTVFDFDFDFKRSHTFYQQLQHCGRKVAIFGTERMDGAWLPIPSLLPSNCCEASAWLCMTADLRASIRIDGWYRYGGQRERLAPLVGPHRKELSRGRLP
jgi:hypothetical protein